MSRRRDHQTTLPGFAPGSVVAPTNGFVVEPSDGARVPAPSLGLTTAPLRSARPLRPHRCKPGRLCTPSRPRCSWMRRRAARPRDQVCDCSAGASYPHRHGSVPWCVESGGGLDALVAEYDRRRGVR